LERLETGVEFRRLVEETRKSDFPRFSDKPVYGLSIWEHAVKNFFRRSGLYLDLTNNDVIDIDAVFQTYLEEFQRLETRVAYLIPIELVTFTESFLDFGKFQIRRYSENELDVILENRINKVFYPNAVIDVKLIKDYWFIHVPPTIPPTIHVTFNDIGKVQLQYTRYPESVELILKRLVLFDWQVDHWRLTSPSASRETNLEDLEKYWIGFGVPFVLVVNNDLLTRPRIAPDTSRLAREPYFDPLTQEEIGEIPTRLINLDEKETEELKVFIQRTDDILSKLEPLPDDWQFLNIALLSLMKAFFSDGLDQLFWHIITLEALLGEKGEGVVKRLAKRIGRIQGRTKTERKNIRKQFRKLYDFRSDLVHGRDIEEHVYVGHLHNARDLARKTILWFLRYLQAIQEAALKEQTEGSVPTRDEILMIIDLDRSSRLRLSQLMPTLPSEFPCVQNWLE
jgi:hypothetical protein